MLAINYHKTCVITNNNICRFIHKAIFYCFGLILFYLVSIYFEIRQRKILNTANILKNNFPFHNMTIKMRASYFLQLQINK